MNARRLHTLAGLILLVPFAAWIVTAFVFYLKPGYDEAYAMLTPKLYPLTAHPVQTAEGWREVRVARTILGDHLLVRTDAGWEQRDPSTGAVRPLPSPDDVRRLVEDAVAGDARYGSISGVDGEVVHTSTGVTVHVDWSRLALSQRGPDTDRIDLLYRIHYLQWTGLPAVYRVLGPLGLLLVALLGALGVRLALQRR